MVLLSETVPAHVAHERPHLLVHDLVVLLEIVTPRETRFAHTAREWFFVCFANMYLAFLHCAEAFGTLSASVWCTVVVAIGVVRAVTCVFAPLNIHDVHFVRRVLAWCIGLGICRPNTRHVALMLHFFVLMRLCPSTAVVTLLLAETLFSYNNTRSSITGMPSVNTRGMHVVISRIRVRVSSKVVEW